jgi:phosphatidylethanolamine/phosphatidyl-N-methylethanolamine N-methyltransferase
MFSECLVFLREGLVNFYHTGSLFPTTRWAASALTYPMRKHAKPQNILEVGAGTGSVTTKILQEMNPGDHLTICEVNSCFMTRLKKKLENNEDYNLLRDNIRLHECLVQDLPEDIQFDVIVCALPFLNFDVATVNDIFCKLSRLSRSDATLSYYEYIGLRPLGKMLSLPQRRQRLSSLDNFFNKQTFARPINRTNVWLNVLPIYVYRMGMVELEDPSRGFLSSQEAEIPEESRQLETSKALF